MGGAAFTTVALLATLFIWSCAAELYYVKPTPNTKCPQGGAACLTLSEYAQNSSRYFTSNSTFEFLPGSHALNSNITVFNISNISLTSHLDNKSLIASWIHCTLPAFFSFAEIKEVRIENLAFTLCGAFASLPRVVFMYDVGQFSVINSTFQRNNGSGLFIQYSSGIVESVTFLSNSAEIYGGGASVMESSVVFRGNAFFSGNTAGNVGGGIYFEKSDIIFQDPVIFANNGKLSEATGGGMATMNSTVRFQSTTIFQGNSATSGGGIYSFKNSSITSDEDITFTGNSAISGGGFFSRYGYVELLGEITFSNNSAEEGGAFLMLGGAYLVKDESVKLLGNVTFSNNSGSVRGSIIVALNISVLISGINTFSDNRNEPGFGGIYTERSQVKINGSNVFSRNMVTQFGAAILAFDVSTVILNGTTRFSRNSATLHNGGAVVAFLSKLEFYGPVEFDSNYAPIGGAITAVTGGELLFMGPTVFTKNFGSQFGGAIYAFVSQLTFKGNTTFDSNHALEVGGVISAAFATLNFNNYCNFTNNSADGGGAIYSHRSDITFTETGGFSSNTARRYAGGAVYTVGGSSFNLKGSFRFHDNKALVGGGAIYTEQDSYLGLMSPLELDFTNNQAKYGGAIYVLDRLTLNYCTDQGLQQVGYCFFEVFSGNNASVNLTPSYDIHLNFSKNKAMDAGSVLYGGLLQQCIIVFPTAASGQSVDKPAIDYFLKISNITAPYNTSIISSDPVKICFCQNGTFHCNSPSPTFSRSPGQSFNVSLVAVDQSTLPVAATVRTTFSMNSTAELGDGEQTQHVDPFCTSLQFTVFSSSKEETLQLSAESDCNKLGTTVHTVSLDLLKCPDGFELLESHCVCEKDLQKFTKTCDVETDSIERTKDFWVNASYNSNGTFKGLIIGPNCPLDYCKNTQVNFTLSDPDGQCAFHRSGILCGGCEPGLSLTIGSSQCARCSDYYLVLLALFALMGFALVLVISLCKLTVKEGTINGLIFYANVVAINKTIFFPAGDTNVLTVFIAWVNLDFGIEVCFYDGMDTYVRTWLQFVFPFYVWLLVGGLILFSKWSRKITKLLGSNPVATLATLFLLSYAKLLRTIMAAFHSTVLEYPDGSEEVVWLFNGNIQYLHGRHIPLFIFALLVLLLLFLPYTIFLLVGQWLVANSDYRVLSWANSHRVKYFLEVNYGPYKNAHRYWTGLLLLLRCALFLVFAFNMFNNPSLNLLVLAASMLGITCLSRLTKGVYKTSSCEFLESLFFLNLGVLAVGTYHVREAGGNQAALTYLSVGVSFVTFLGIALVQAFIQFKDTRPGIWLFGHLAAWLHPNGPEPHVQIPEDEDGSVDGEDAPLIPQSVSFVNFREPLIADTR